MEELNAPNIERWRVVQTFVDLYTYARYLEVGVNKGITFDRITAGTKVAVDPTFQFDWRAEQDRRGPSTRYHEVTSDQYFGTIIGDDEAFDVIYLDGLHTFEQTLRDLINALEYLAPGGVIVIDDVRPSSYHASLPNMGRSIQVRKFVGDTSPHWMGDVYRLIWFIDTFFQTLSYATIANNHGQAVVWRERRPEVTQRSVRAVAELSFESLVLDIDVMHGRPFGEIVADVRGAVGELHPHP